MNRREQTVYLFEKYLPKEGVNFPRQAQIAKRLLDKYGFEIWKYVNIGFELYSLKVFEGDFGVKEIEKAQKKMKQASYEKTEVDIGEELVYVPAETAAPKPTLKERLLA